MKKKSLLLLPTLVGLLLCGCNSGGNSQDNPTTKESDPTSSVSPTSSVGPTSATPTSAPAPTSEPQPTSSSQPTSSTPTPSSSSQPGPVVVKHVITFKDEAGDILDSREWEQGSIPSYSYNKADTAEWDYTVEGWSLTQGGAVITLPAVTADTTYYAVVSQVKKSYTITFYNHEGSQIQSEVLEYGAQPTCDYLGPDDTDEWDYTFNGWSTSQHGAILPSIPTVTGEANYYAQVSSTKQSYEIKFCENDGYILYATSLPYGTTPSYEYEIGSSMEWDITFLGWATSKDGTPLANLPIVTGSATYYAQLNKVKKQYTITFDSRSGSAVDSITEDYGTNVSKPTDPKRDGYNFVAWSTDPDGENKVTWPYTLVSNVTFYANWNEKVDIKGYFKTLMQIVNHDPYSYIPSKMKKDNSGIRVTAEEVNYNFNNSTSVSNIKYGGFGEQWHMVIENIEQSELFYSVLAIGETAMNASVVLFNNYLDNNPGDTASHTLDETTYTASIDFHNGLLTYSIRYKTNLDIPFFGNVTPQVDMTYNVTSLEKTVRIQLTENNAMKYSLTDDQYIFGLQYGVETVSRKAYFSLNRNDDESVEGHIYEFVQYKDKDLVPACADFYINEDYTSVVGNKARGLAGFKGYINELYKTDEGKLLGYEVRETLTIAGVTGQYNTLWFNLNNITGITSVKAVENENNTGTYSNKNPHDIYLNGSASIFEPAYNTKLLVKTSRKYDVELRKQYFYGYQDDKLVEYETNIPMMFIQDDNDKDTNFSDFPTDMATKSGIPASVNLSETYLDKIRDDYASLIDVFIEHKDDVSGDTITDFIGSALILSE